LLPPARGLAFALIAPRVMLQRIFRGITRFCFSLCAVADPFFLTRVFFLPPSAQARMIGFGQTMRNGTESGVVIEASFAPLDSLSVFSNVFFLLPFFTPPFCFCVSLPAFFWPHLFDYRRKLDRLSSLLTPAGRPLLTSPVIRAGAFFSPAPQGLLLSQLPSSYLRLKLLRFVEEHSFFDQVMKPFPTSFSVYHLAPLSPFPFNPPFQYRSLHCLRYF